MGKLDGYDGTEEARLYSEMTVRERCTRNENLRYLHS